MKKLISRVMIGLVLLLSACNLPQSPAGKEAVTLTPAGQVPTQTAQPTAAPTARPTATSPAPPAPTRPPATVTPTPLPAVPIVYYYFVELTGKAVPAGSVVILPDILVLGPTLTKTARTADSTANIEAALQAMIRDPRNAWTSSGLSITRLTFHQGAAQVALQGEYFAPGDIVLIAARMQILLTIFAEATVQTAIVTLNGKNIANLGISHSSQVRPADTAFTRAEIEVFLKENAYGNP